MADQPNSDGSLFLAFGPSPPGAADSLELHLSPSLEADLLDLLDTHDLRRSQVIHASGGPGLAIYPVYSVGGFATALGRFKGLAAVLTALFHRHDSKRLTVKTAGLEFSVQGVSDKDAERWIQLAVDQIKAQAEARKQLGDGNQPPSPNE
jgi:hypothetical protein